jgi:DNA-binding NarL/FixJ family response regulator
MGLRVLLADDHFVVRKGMRSLLESGGFEIVGEAADGHEAVKLAGEVRYDVAVLDLCMPRMNGLDAAREILAKAPAARIVVLTMVVEEPQVKAAFRAGARGYVLKTQAGDDLLHAVREVSAGHRYVSPRVSSVLLDSYLTGGTIGNDPLTSRERQLLQLVAEGKSTKEVADVLGVTVKTAECYRSRLKEKLDIHHTAGLVCYAIRAGVIQLLVVLALLGEDPQLVGGMSPGAPDFAPWEQAESDADEDDDFLPSSGKRRGGPAWARAHHPRFSTPI